MKFANSNELSAEYGGIRVRPFLRDINRSEHVTSCHWHDCYEIIYIVSGEHLLRLNLSETVVHAGEIIFIEPGIIHESHCISDESGFGRTIVVQFDRELIAQAHRGSDYTFHMKMCLSKNRLDFDLERHIFADTGLGELVERSLDEYNRCEQGWKFVVRGLVLELYGLLERASPTPDSSSSKSADSTETVIAACKQIEASYREPLKLDELAKSVGYSPTYFSALFRRVLGISFREYLEFVRMCEAQRLIWDGETRLDDVAAAVGYRSTSAFCRAFKRVTGFTPAKCVYHDLNMADFNFKEE